MAIRKVWINEDCTLCGLCVSICPEVFEMGDETARIIEDASLNDTETCIRDAAEECPVKVIEFEE